MKKVQNSRWNWWAPVFIGLNSFAMRLLRKVWTKIFCVVSIRVVSICRRISRDLKYVVVFPEYQGKHHTFLIKQTLPAAVYVSTDQLEDLKRFDKVCNYCLQLKSRNILTNFLQFFQINYFIDRDLIDIEIPTEKSEPFNIHLFGDTAFLQTISLPIHFRYHAPGNRRYAWRHRWSQRIKFYSNWIFCPFGLALSMLALVSRNFLLKWMEI